MKNKTLKIIIILATAITFIFSGCSKGSKEPKLKQQSQEGSQQSDKIPEQLSELEENIEKIIKALNGPSVAVKEDKEKMGTESQGNKQASEGSSDSQGEGNKKEEQQSDKGKGSEGEQKAQGGQQGGQQGQQPQKKDPWQKITPIINDMHYKWNSYLPQAAKTGASKASIDNFSNALNSLTNTVISKNKTNTLMAASYLYAYIPDFYSLYRSGTSPEIKRIRHYTRNAMLNAMTANWVQADSDINNLKSSWSLFKNTVPKEKLEESGKLDFSIYELEKVIKQKNQPLTDIKGRVTITNIETLEKSMEKGGGAGGQAGGNTSGSEGGQGGGSSSESGGAER